MTNAQNYRGEAVPVVERVDPVEFSRLRFLTFAFGREGPMDAPLPTPPVAGREYFVAPPRPVAAADLHNRQLCVIVAIICPNPISPTAFISSIRASEAEDLKRCTRLALGLDRVEVEIDLTPGVDVAPMVFALINTNRDGRISEAEGRAYATQMLKEIVLEVDGRQQILTLVSSRFPSFQEMSAGIGTIRIDARAVWPDGPGRHSLSYQNNHRPDLGAYLVNALLPKNRDIEITEQHRDFLQRGIRLTFNVKSPVDRSTLPPRPHVLRLGLSVLVGYAYNRHAAHAGK